MFDLPTSPGRSPLAKLEPAERAVLAAQADWIRHERPPPFATAV